MFSDHNSIKLEMGIRKIIEISPKTGKLNNKLLNNPWGKEVWCEIKKKKHTKIPLNWNENTAFETLWDEAKAVPKGKFIALSVYIKRNYTDCVNSSWMMIQKALVDQEMSFSRSWENLPRMDNVINRRMTWLKTWTSREAVLLGYSASAPVLHDYFAFAWFLSLVKNKLGGTLVS